MQKQGLYQALKLPLALGNIILPLRELKPKNMLWSLNKVHFHFTLSMWAYQLQVEFLFLTIQPFEDFQEPLEFHGHGSWYVCKATLMLISPHQIDDCHTFYTNMWKLGCLHEEIVSFSIQITGDKDQTTNTCKFVCLSVQQPQQKYVYNTSSVKLVCGN